jgi:predicted acyl esterase
VSSAAVLLISGLTVYARSAAYRSTRGSGTVAAAAGSISAAGTYTETVLAADGTRLSAVVIIPSHVNGSKVPVVVAPASWGAKESEYGYAAITLAQHGYEIVTYAQRGFPDSAGQVDFAADKTQQDVGTVVDWALAHTPADGTAVGMLGVSYGGGMALLAAERDSRIKAVVAMSAWTDLSAALAPNATVNSATIKSLINPQSTTTYTGELAAVAQALAVGNGSPAVTMASNPVRSAETNVAALNRNGTAVMIANDSQDSIIAPNQLVTFFDELTGPKRLRLDVGDHGSNEVSAFSNEQAAQTGVWKDALDWLNHYLRGVNNGVQRVAPVQLRDAVTKAWFGYPTWAAAGLATTYSINLSTTYGSSIGTLSSAPTTTRWSRSLIAGTATVADSGPIQANEPSYVAPSTTALATTPGRVGIVAAGTPLTASRMVSGTPSARLTVTGAAGPATIFVYLYDVAPTGRATLISFAPYSTSGAKGSTTTFTVALRPVEWTVAARHRLALAIDTVDQRFLSANPAGATVTLTSTAQAQSTLTVPFAA